MNKTTARTLAAVGILGTAAAFIGHGALAVARDPLWVGLFRDSLAAMGINLSQATVSGMTQTVGAADVVFGLLLVAAAAGLFGNSAVKRTVMSRAMFYVLGIAAFWQAATAAAVMVASGSLTPGVWSFLADAPNFVLPVAVILLLRQLRQEK